MKSIKKVLLALTIITMCLNVVTSTQTKLKSKVALKTASLAKIGLNSNYKMTLGNLIAKANKKSADCPTKKDTLIDNQDSKNSRGKNNPNENNGNSGNHIYFKGWLKYFRYSEDKKIVKPKEFFKNTLYDMYLSHNKNYTSTKDDVK